ncbi:MAG: DUF3079 domain-containing protein [Candidatus Accumulibacter sp.]|jgi:hypothetical protein|nr:DUF3079 domain-containing protein [Accumulibacter sp.]
MAKKFPLQPKHPERICWGCDKYCPVDSLGCGNGSDRTQHPAELLGEDWYAWGDWGILTPPEEGEVNGSGNERQDSERDNGVNAE